MEFEVEMRVAGQVLDPRPAERNGGIVSSREVPRRQPRPMANWVQQPGNIKDRMGSAHTKERRPQTRAWYKCHQVGHIARGYLQKREGGPINKTASDKPNPLVAHKLKDIYVNLATRRGTIALSVD